MKIIDKIKEIVKDDKVYFNANTEQLLQKNYTIIGGSIIGGYELVHMCTDIKRYVGMEGIYEGIELKETSNGWTVSKIYF